MAAPIAMAAATPAEIPATRTVWETGVEQSFENPAELEQVAPCCLLTQVPEAPVPHHPQGASSMQSWQDGGPAHGLKQDEPFPPHTPHLS